jgi:hypothetical protein
VHLQTNERKWNGNGGDGEAERLGGEIGENSPEIQTITREKIPRV